MSTILSLSFFQIVVGFLSAASVCSFTIWLVAVFLQIQHVLILGMGWHLTSFAVLGSRVHLSLGIPVLLVQCLPTGLHQLVVILVVALVSPLAVGYAFMQAATSSAIDYHSTVAVRDFKLSSSQWAAVFGYCSGPFSLIPVGISGLGTVMHLILHFLLVQLDLEKFILSPVIPIIGGMRVSDFIELMVTLVMITALFVFRWSIYYAASSLYQYVIHHTDT